MSEELKSNGWNNWLSGYMIEPAAESLFWADRIGSKTGIMRQDWSLMQLEAQGQGQPC